MTKFFKPCQACHKTKFIIKQREYKVPNSKATMVSQSLLCRKCYKNIKEAISKF